MNTFPFLQPDQRCRLFPSRDVEHKRSKYLGLITLSLFIIGCNTNQPDSSATVQVSSVVTSRWETTQATEKVRIAAGLDILVKEGSEKAKIYFRDLYRDTDSEEAAFYLAWSHYRSGETNAAEEINDTLLADTSDTWIQGKCWYLKGLIAYNDGKYENTRKYLKKALAEHLDKDDRDYISVLFGTCLLSEKKFQEAIDHIQNSRVENGYSWDILSKCFLALHQYDEALILNEKALNWYKGMDRYYFNTLSQRGFIRFLSGDISGGSKDTELVDEYCKRNKVVKLSYYNTLNWILMLRCSNKDISVFTGRIQSYVDTSGDKWLTDMLTFVTEWDCVVN